MNTVAIIQARMGSSRFPGKVLAELPGGNALQIIYNRVKAARFVDHVIVATSINKSDDLLKIFCNEFNMDCYRGSEDDVLERVCQAAYETDADQLVDITADCPLVDPAHIDKLIGNLDGFEYVSNCEPKRMWPDGLDVSVYTCDALFAANRNPNSIREHVGWNIPRTLSKSECYQVENIMPLKYNRPEIAVTLDTREDYLLLKHIFEAMLEKYKHVLFPVESALDWLFENQHLLRLNKHIKRRTPNGTK